jgi:hypothetical protein
MQKQEQMEMKNTDTAVDYVIITILAFYWLSMFCVLQ